MFYLLPRGNAYNETLEINSKPFSGQLDMELKKKEDQSVDTSTLLRRENKIPMEGVTEIKCKAETEGMTIQRLPPPRNPSHKQLPNTDTIVGTNKSLLYQVAPDKAVS